MIASYATLLERVGHYLFGVRTGFSSDQEDDILDCMRDGLHRVYASHNWSFFRPLTDVTTTAPYTTGTVAISSGVVTLTGGTFPTWAADGIFKVSGRYYSVASRHGNTQINLDDTTVTVASGATYSLGRPEIPMDAAFDAVANDSDLAYYPGPKTWYPAVKQRPDDTIRKLEYSNPEFNRPVFYSVRTTEFDATVGSRRTLAFYPTPDQAYVLRVPMVLRPIMLDATNQYPIGGELLSLVILEACLAAAERNFEEREHVHEKHYQEMIVLAIRNDQDRSSPRSLGPDSPYTSYGTSGVIDYNHLAREHRIGQISLDGDIL